MSSDNFIIHWKKGEDISLTSSFKSSEFTCQCNHPECVTQSISLELLTRLQRVRNNLGKPITITSGYRCTAHQNELRGSGMFETAKGTSSHELGLAADIHADDMNTLEVLCNAQFDNIGTAKTFIHVDTREPKADGSKRLWSYK
jgi:uncharacterized protein YcbK (DUF882 family)